MKPLGDSLQILVVVNCRRGEELRHLFQHNLPEITGKLANGTPWTVTTKSIVVGKKRYPAYIQEDSSGDLMLLTGPRKEADYLRQRLLGIRQQRERLIARCGNMDEETEERRFFWVFDPSKLVF